MKRTLVGAMVLVAANAYAAPDGENQPTPETTPPPAEPAPTPAAPVPPPAQPQIIAEVTQPTQPWYVRMGWGLTIGGGVEGFTNDTMRDSTEDGGGWVIRVGVGTRLPVSFEASYIGSAQDLNALGLSPDAILVGNGAQGVIRLNATFGDIAMQPFIFGGVAWRHYNVENTDFNTSDIQNSTNVLEVPAGAGFAYKQGGFTVDVRGEYRPSFFGHLEPSAFDPGEEASLTRWAVNGTLGVEF